MSLPLRQKILAGQRALGSMIFEFTSPGIPQLLNLAGAEFIIYDMEHAGLGFETLKSQVAACRGLPITPLARPASSTYTHIARLLDIGMRGIMVPMVESAQQAKDIVEYCHYPPQGRRGAAFGFAHDHYEPGDPAKKITVANDEILVIAQVETERGLANVNEIAAVPGVDVLWIGQFDLTNFLGIAGQFTHPTYLEACATIINAARQNNKKMGIMAPNPQWAADYAKEGYDMIATGPEGALLVAGITTILEAAK